MFEVYVSLKGKKHYLVFDGKTVYTDCVKASTRYFRCGEKNLEVEEGWVLNDELYLDNPHVKGSKRVAVVSHWRKA